MSDILRNDDEHVSPDAVEGAHDSDGTMGRAAGTDAGLISGGVVGMAVGGPVGAVVGAVAGAVLGHAGGDAAHDIGNDHADVNVESGGDPGKNAGAGAGAISGAVVGSTVGPVGTVTGAVAGGMLGAAAGDAAKDTGTDRGDYGDTGYATDRVANTGYAAADVPGGRVAATAGVADLTAGNVHHAVHTGDAGETVRLHEERLDVNKQAVQTGEVAIRKEVITEQKTIEVPVTREEIVIEHHPVSGVEASDFRAEDQEIRIPVSEEKITIEKTPVVTEEVSVGKRTVQETQTVSDTVRREEARVEQSGATRVVGDMGNDIPGVQTGGSTTAGQDTRGLTEKAADALTGDKTGGRVL